MEIINQASNSAETKHSYGFTATEFAKGIRILQGYGVIHWEVIDDGKQSIEFRTWYQSIAVSFDLETYMQAVKNLEDFKGYMTLGVLREWCRAARKPKYKQLEQDCKTVSRETAKKRIKELREKLNL